jgi:hypothetical protein
MDRRRLLIVLVTLGIVALAFVPAALTFGLGWLSPPHIQPWGAPPARDTTTLEGWTVFAAVYFGWMIGLMVLLVWAYDRLDYHWQYHERKPRPEKKGRRRALAAMRHVGAEDEAMREAMRRRAERHERRRRDAAAARKGGR